MAKRGIVQVGQSNHMTGYADDRADWARGHSRLYQFKQDRTTVLAVQPLDNPASTAGRPFTASAYYLARDYLIPRNPGIDYCILPLAYGGSGFHAPDDNAWHAPHPPDYATGGARYVFAVGQMNAFLAAEAGNTIDVVILQNGEQDTGSAQTNVGYYGGSYGLSDYAAYTRYVVEFVAGLVADVPLASPGGVRGWPLLIGAMPPDTVWAPTFPILPNYPSGIGPSADGTGHPLSAAIPIWEACRDMPGAIPNCFFYDSLNPVKIPIHAGPCVDGTGHVWLNSSEYFVHYSQVGLREMAHRQFRAYAKAKNLGTAVTMTYGKAPATAPVTTANIWMAAPDVIAFYVDDPPFLPGNIEMGSFSGLAYNVWTQRTNPRSGDLEWCMPIGKNRDRVRYADLPNPAGYLDKMAMHNLANYTVTGATPTALYFRDEGIENGARFSSGGAQSLMLTQRHTIYLKLPAVPVNGTVFTISNSQPNTFTPLTFTYNDKTTRAGAIQVNQIGYRPSDALRYAYLSARIPGGPNKGAVDFATTYGYTSFQVLDSGKNTVFTGAITQRVGNAATTGEGYDTGIDLADLSTAVTVTAITKGATTVVRCPGHSFQVGDKVRFWGIAGATQFNDASSINSPFYQAPAVTAVGSPTVDDITVAINSSSFGTFTTTPAFSVPLGGTSNRIYKAFNTNRAGTNVFGLDFGAWTPTTSGTHYLYIPGYGISDPFQVTSNTWAVAAGKTHEGIFNQRLGCAVSSSSGYIRGAALVDGVNGCTNYQSTLVSVFSTEGGQRIDPAGAPAGGIHSNLGAYADIGTLNISSGTATGGIATLNTVAPHGVTVGQSFGVQIIGCTPATYNAVGVATSTGASQFTISLSGGSATPITVGGFVRTGFVTNVRTGTKAAVQDAGDNDDSGADHFPPYNILAFVFQNIPKPSRFTPYTVPFSTSLLDPTLFAGTDALPPIFHELFWYAEAYRTGQMPDGSVWGGYGIGATNTNLIFSSQIATYPETIDITRGNDAGGPLTGQTVMGYAYARDHFTTFLYSTFAAQLAMIAYDYGLTTLGNTYKASAIAAYAWADSLYVDMTACDAYYKGTLNLQAKANWSNTSYINAMFELNGYGKRVGVAKFEAAGSLFRLLGSTAGQTPYGDFVEHKAVYVAAIVAGGSGYAVDDFIVLAGGTQIVRTMLRVTAVSSGAVSAVTIMRSGQYSVVPTNPAAQFSTTGSGTGATFNLTTTAAYNLFTASIGGYNYCATPGANSAAKTALQSTYNNTNYNVGLNPNMSYMGMMWSTAASTSGGAKMSNPYATLQAHMNYVAVNGVVSGAYSSNYIKLLQAGCSFFLGGNMTGKAFQTGVGPRPFKLMLHEDSWKLGQAAPNGLLPYGYFSWCYSGFNNFAGSVAGTDGALNYNADNVTGAAESEPTPGSAKLWGAWKYACSYWEHSPENKNMIQNSEFDLAQLVSALAVELYLHGWDGNV